MQRLARILVITVLGALLAGCVAQPAAPVTPPPPFRSEAEAFEAAEATYRAYVDALNRVDLADPATFEAVYEWTTGELNAGERQLFSRMHADRESVTGESRIELFLPSTFDAIAGAVTADVCLDVSGVEVLDQTGASVVAIDRVDVQSMRVKFVPGANAERLAIESVNGRSDGPTC